MTKAKLHAIVVELSEQKAEAERREATLQGENIVLRSRLLQLSQDYQALLDKMHQHKVIN